MLTSCSGLSLSGLCCCDNTNTDMYMDMHMYICSCITMGIYTCTCTCALHVRVCTYFHPFEPRPARGHFDSPVLREAVIFARAQRKTTGSECDYYGCFTIALRCESASHLLGQILYMFDYNVRQTSILGIVGAGGIGFFIINYIKFFEYGKAAIFLVIVLITVLIIDWVSVKIRDKYIIKSQHGVEVKRKKSLFS